MKKTFSAALIVTFALAPFSQSLAQRLPSPEKRALRQQQRAQFGPAKVSADGRGALIHWEMASEPNTVGYNVYQIDAWGARLVTKRLIAGSAARIGRGENEPGEKYKVFDPDGGRGMAYVIEVISLDGTRAFSKQLSAAYVHDIEQATGISIDQIEKETSSKGQFIESSALALTPELRSVVSNSEQPSDVVMHRWVASQQGASIGIKQDGIYRVSKQSLADANFQASTDPANWRLFLNGVEHPIIVGPNGDYIEFFGRGIDTLEADTRVYYLIADTVPGKRMTSRILRPGPGSIVAPSFTMEAVKKERGSYDPNILNGEEGNHWGAIVTSSGQVEVEFDLVDIDPTAANSVVQVKLQGFSPTQHSTRVFLNGIEIGTATGTGRNSYSGEFTVPTSLLTDAGDKNTLGVASTASNDFVYFDSVSVEYPRKYKADQNRLAFSSPGFRRVRVDGFISQNIRVFDTTFDAQPQLVANAEVINNGGTFSVRLPSARAAVFHAVESSGVLTPAAVTENKPSALSSVVNSADLVIISHSSPDFIAAAEQWAEYRRNQGFTVKVVDIRDVIDEFNYGVHGWLAIKQFLQFAKENWQNSPDYVLMLGDGSRDPRNFENGGKWDLVPTKLVDTVFEETGSDEALADFDGDGLAEMAIGRIPARQAAEITSALGKTVAFEADATRFDRGALFVYGPPDPNNFQYISDTLREQLPPSMPAEFIQGLASSHQTLIDSLNTGKYISNYAGHGTTGAWSPVSFFALSHVPLLTNANKQTIFTMLTCLNGYFVHSKNDSLSESLLKSQTGGAVAAWSSSGKTTSDFQLVMGTRFYNQLGAGQITRIGDLIKDAKAALTAGSDVKFSWVLLGDPMLKVR